jgi:4-alpha-glucanotransferase
MLDILRIDHFIGFARFYSIPINQTPRDGFWSDSPGDKLLRSLSIDKNSYDIFVEDLGDVTREVVDLRDQYKLSGTRVVQFDLNDSLSRYDYSSDTVLYTGTHDNDTLIGWLESLNDQQRNTAYDMFSEKDIRWELIQYAMNSRCERVIIPLQDVLGLGSEHRLNTPGTLSKSNWVWRFSSQDVSKDVIDRMRVITEDSRRCKILKKGETV